MALVALKARQDARQVLESVATNATGQRTITLLKEPTSTGQSISVQQSTEIIQTLLHGSISVLSYLRNLFDESCFEDRFYGVSDNFMSYKEFVQGKQAREPSEDSIASTTSGQRSGRRHGTDIKVLKRGQTKAGDQFLDWLEMGVFDALRLRVLRAMQLTIFEDATRSHHVVESYTFTFNYDDTSNGRSISGMNMQGPNGQEISVRNVRFALGIFIRRLIALCSTLPDLPESRFLKIHLFYNESCDPDYEPQGFSASLNNEIKFPDGNEWTTASQYCGVLDAGFLQSSLRVRHLEPNSDHVFSSGNGPLLIKEQLCYTHEADREDEIDHELEKQGVSRVGQHISRPETQPPDQSIDTSILAAGGLAQQNLERPLDEDELDLDGNSVVERGQENLVNWRAAAKDDEFATGRPEVEMTDTQTTTQLPGDTEAIKTLQQMLQPSPVNENLDETQKQTQAHGSSQPREDSLEGMLPLKLCALKREELVRRANDPDNAVSTIESSSIDCQCGGQDRTEDMIQCAYCNTWQHVQCHGFRGSDDTRVPLEHACYRCLLQENEPGLFHEMENLTLLRKGAHVASKEGYSNDKSYAEALHCDIQTASKVVKYLRNKGFLVPTRGSHAKGFYKTGKPRYHLANTEHLRRCIQEELFDPLTMIGHLFEIPQGPVGIPVSVSTQVIPPPPLDSGAGHSLTDAQPNSMMVTQRDLGSSYELGRPASRPIDDQQAHKLQAASHQGERRYPIRQRSSSIMGATGTSRDLSAGKRGLEDGREVSGSTRNAKKRLKSSMTKGLIKIGYHTSPTPAPDN